MSELTLKFSGEAVKDYKYWQGDITWSLTVWSEL